MTSLYCGREEMSSLVTMLIMEGWGWELRMQIDIPLFNCLEVLTHYKLGLKHIFTQIDKWVRSRIIMIRLIRLGLLQFGKTHIKNYLFKSKFKGG